MPAARDALVWLESLGPPSIADSPSRRDGDSARYVPANDDARLPRERHRTARSFDTAVLVDRDLDYQYIWPEATPAAEQRQTLETVCAGVTHVGTTHSIALMSLVDDPRLPTWLPTAGPGDWTQRTILPGRLDEADRCYEDGKRLHGGACETWTTYRRADADRSYDPARVIALKLIGDLAAEHSIHLSVAMFAALQAEIPDSELDTTARAVHGHDPNGSSRLRILPVPDVGHRHATGRVLGVFIDMPEPEMRTSVLSALARLGPLMLPGNKRVTLAVPVPGRPIAHGLRPHTWTEPSRIWTTALAAVLDRFPKRQLSVEQIVRVSCANAGLPAPAAIEVGPNGYLRGVDFAQRYALRPKQPGPLVHVYLRFDERLAPDAALTIGRSRNYGLGLLRPLSIQED